MTILSTLLVLSLSLVTFSQPAAKPNFSGDWKMNAAKSNFGPLPAPTSITRKITHSEPALTIVEDQDSPMGNQSVTRKYVTDGTETSFNAQGTDVKTSAKWDSATLVVVSDVTAIGLVFHDTMSLSADGKTLTSTIKLSSPQGDADITIVFEK